MDKEHYGALGHSRNASDADIRKVYLQLALRYHSDKNKTPDAASTFREVDTAYKVLTNKERRKDYDRKLDEQDFTRNSSGGGNQWENGGSARFGGKGHVSAPFGLDCRASSGIASSSETPFERWPRGAQNTASGSGTPPGGIIFWGTNFAMQSTDYHYWPDFSGKRCWCSSCARGRAENGRMRENQPMNLDLYLSLGEALHACTKYKTIISTVMSPDGLTTKHERKVLTINVKPGSREGTTIRFHGEGNRISVPIPADVAFTVRFQRHP